VAVPETYAPVAAAHVLSPDAVLHAHVARSVAVPEIYAPAVVERVLSPDAALHAHAVQ